MLQQQKKSGGTVSLKMVSGTGLGQEGCCGCFPKSFSSWPLEMLQGLMQMLGGLNPSSMALLPQIALACLDALPGTCQGL